MARSKQHRNKAMNTLFRNLIGLSILFSAHSQSALLSDSILEIPKATLFELRRELEIPANQDFVLLGKDQLNESFNSINQTFNRSEHAYKNNHQPFYHYDDYLKQWQESVGKSYKDCLNRHHVYEPRLRRDKDNNTIINSGNGNTNVIINNQTNTAPTYSSYIGDNNCIKPEHSIAALLIDSEESESGGIFRDGYQFKVKSVRHKRRGDFNIITIYFDHKIAKAIRVITTKPANKITINHLQYHEAEDGFWAGISSALESLTNLGDDYFIIKLPSKHYYK